MHNFQTDWVAKWAKYSPASLFLREHERGLQWNYSEFNKRTNAFANYLKNDIRITKGDRIAIYSRNRSEHVMLFLACIKTGAILVPLNFRLTQREIDVMISDAEPTIFFYEKDLYDQVNLLSSVHKIKYKSDLSQITQFLTEPIVTHGEIGNTHHNENDIVMILYTAGTTGIPKGVIVTNKMLFWNSVNTSLRLDLTSSDHTQSFAPFFHTGGWNVLFTPFLHQGASHTLLTNFDADLILQLMEKEKTTILFGVPTMLQMMAESPYFSEVDLSSVRYAIVGGAPMPIPLINTWHEKGIYIRQGYGLTEVGPNCFSLHQNDAIRKKGSIGFPNFYIEAKIMDESGKEVNDNKVGELWLKSPVVTPGYWRKDKETSESITDGWFHTGDMVIKDEEGYYFVVDRKKNMYISGGENVFPAEIESVIYSNDAIKEVAIIGVPDDRWGEVGKAFIVLRKPGSINKKDLINYCEGKLAKYKIPKHIVFLDTLPKNEAGKVDKKKLKAIGQSN